MATKTNPGAFDPMPKTANDEPYFVLVARDPSAACLIGLWTAIREKMRPADTAQILEAAGCANAAATYCAGLGPEKQKAMLDASQALTQVAMELLLQAATTMEPAMRQAWADKLLGKTP